MSKKIALVTGGNRGIGWEVCKQLASKHGVHVLMGTRSLEKGTEAVVRLQKAVETAVDVTPVQIDVSSAESIAACHKEVKERFGGLDILVNNAGVLWREDLFEDSDEHIQQSVDINILGVIRCTRAFAKEMKNGGRIVNLSSGYGQFADGLPGPDMYSISKASVNAITLTSSRHAPKGVLINSVCPGWCRTDMGGDQAGRSAAKGAETVVWAAMLPDDGPTGKFFRDMKEIPW